MKTKLCKHCKEEINKKAKRCPHCGGKLGMSSLIKIFIIVGIIIVGIAGCANSFKEAVEEVEESFKDKNGRTSFKLNETFENSYSKITMTEINKDFRDYNDYLGPSDGNKVLMVKFEFENIKDDDDEQYISSADFNAYVDGVAVKEFYYADDKYTDLSATVGKNKKAVGYVFYEIPKNANKITIEYNANFWVDGNTIEFIVK